MDGEEVGGQGCPFGVEGSGKDGASRAAIPVRRVRRVAFLAMEVGVKPGRVRVLDILRDRAGRSSWDLQLALAGLDKIAQETGGECFSLSTTQLVSFKPYLDRMSNELANQYFLEFAAVPKGNKGSLQRINLQTEIPNSELLAPDNVWVEAPGAGKK